MRFTTKFIGLFFFYLLLALAAGLMADHSFEQEYNRIGTFFSALTAFLIGMGLYQLTEG